MSVQTVLRVLAVMAGLAFLLSSVLMIADTEYFGGLGGVFWAGIFLLYGYGGNKYVYKILPGYAT